MDQLPSSAEACRAWVRDRIARAGLTEEIEMHAAHLTAYGLDYDAAEYVADDAESEYLADVFAESAEDYQRDYADNYDADGRYFGKDEPFEVPEHWQEADAHPEG